MPRKRNPRTRKEWQAAIDAATGALALDSARQYGLVRGGPRVNVERCLEVLDAAKKKGMAASADAIERFMQALLEDNRDPRSTKSVSSSGQSFSPGT